MVIGYYYNNIHNALRFIQLKVVSSRLKRSQVVSAHGMSFCKVRNRKGKATGKAHR